jgi:response regulator RpfG family c-di-GMP phosphodiesterase
MTPAHPLPPNPAQASVLIVDDEELLVLAYKEMFESEGYRTVTALSAVDAVKRLEEEPFAVVLTDQNMPKENGLEFLAKVKSIQPDATRVLMTGVLDLSTVIQAINKGEIYRFVVKPCLREDLLATIKNAIQRYELIGQNTMLQAATQSMNRELEELNRALAKQVAREAEQNAQLADLNHALQQNLQRSVELCLKTLETFYPSLGVQAKRVHELCASMAEGINLPPNQKQILEISAWLHDVGLVGVPRRLIKLWQEKPESLNPAELALVKQHPVMGQELAAFVHNLSDVGTVIRSHHERFDGTGYPDRRSGDQIPWLGRLLAVAVSYAENLTVGRDALATIQRGSGSAFDPEAVRVLTKYRPASMTRNQREIKLAELRPGMVLADGVYTANGLLLIPEGLMLNEPYIDKLRNHNRVNPIHQALLIYC